jgi:hypothetical protein
MSDLRSKVPGHIETFFGLAVDGALAGRVGLTLIAGIAAGTPRRERRKEAESAESARARRALAGEQDLPFEEPSSEPKTVSEEKKVASGEVVVGVLGSAAERIASHWRKGEVSGGLVNAPAASAVPLDQEPERAVSPPVAASASAAPASGIPSAGAPSPSAGIVTKPAKSWSAYLAEATAEPSVAPTPSESRFESVPNAPVPSSPRADEVPRRPLTDLVAARPPSASPGAGGAQPAAQSPLKKAPSKPGSGGAEPEQMQFEPVQRGHFQETSQTVIDGQDLDVPTFLRRRNGQK